MTVFTKSHEKSVYKTTSAISINAHLSTRRNAGRNQPRVVVSSNNNVARIPRSLPCMSDRFLTIFGPVLLYEIGRWLAVLLAIEHLATKSHFFLPNVHFSLWRAVGRTLLDSAKFVRSRCTKKSFCPSDKVLLSPYLYKTSLFPRFTLYMGRRYYGVILNLDRLYCSRT
jgi:hypothetical protein